MIFEITRKMFFSKLRKYINILCYYKLQMYQFFKVNFKPENKLLTCAYRDS